ncbi:MAG TPA: deoxyguanosinetriphosphate triphosphohydrolase, partial [Lachnospiraceae bacterium]|nr:deoxyguanosinetriphosphate triphosphohydrolase [Lachnospiraceae bacterium]
DIPKELRSTLGKTTTQRLDRFIHDIIINSINKNDICMSDEIGEAMMELRTFMFINVYQNPKAKGEEGKAERLVEALYQYFLEHLEELPAEYLHIMEVHKECMDRVVCDYVSSMSDRFAIGIFSDIYLPDSWKD